MNTLNVQKSKFSQNFLQKPLLNEYNKISKNFSKTMVICHRFFILFQRANKSLSTGYLKCIKITFFKNYKTLFS